MCKRFVVVEQIGNAIGADTLGESREQGDAVEIQTQKRHAPQLSQLEWQSARACTFEDALSD